jgi:crotonobetainyl-CoA:carnitine CoA-transferase CaiB-like acyl-CoA transferase
MTDNVFPWMYWQFGNGFAAGGWPRRGAELLTGASPRYRLYRTADDRYVAAAPLEDRFWRQFCELIDLPDDLRDDEDDPAATAAAVAGLVAARTAEDWQARFDEADVCCSIVRTAEEAAHDPAFLERGIFAGETGDGEGATLRALPMPLDPGLRAREITPAAPRLGEHSLESET